jgi:hypothetical protein
MTTLHYSEDRWYALHHVGDELVAHHGISEVAQPGFSWTTTSMTDELNAVMCDLLHAGLISIGHHSPWGAKVLLTVEGSKRLVAWNLQHAGGVA